MGYGFLAVRKWYNFHEFGWHLGHGGYRDCSEYGVCTEPVDFRLVSAMAIAVAAPGNDEPGLATALNLSGELDFP